MKRIIPALVEIFRKNLFINSLLFLPYIFLVRAKTLMSPVAQVADSTQTEAGQWVFNTIQNPLLQSILAGLLVFIQAIYLNRIAIKHRLGLEISLIPGLMYILLMSLFPEYSILSTALIGNLFILIALSQLFKIYKRPSVADNIFNIGFFAALSSIFMPEYAIFILIGLLGISILRSLKIREFLQLMLGCLTLYFLYFTIFYLNDIPIMPEIDKFLPTFGLGITLPRNWGLYKMIFITFLGVYSVFSYRTYTLKKSIQAQKKVDILFWTSLASVLLLLFQTTIISTHALILFIPLSLFLSINLLKLKSKIYQEMIHLIILIIIFAFQFGWIGG